MSIVFSIKVEAVDLIGDGKAPRIPQPEEGATYDKIWKKKEVAKVKGAFLLSCKFNVIVVRGSVFSYN